MNHGTAGFILAIFIFSSASGTVSAQDHQNMEAADPGFEWLFNGHSMDGWRGFRKEHLPGKWVVEDGILHFDPEGKGDGGDIIYDRVFANFHLKLEWKISEGGNSGIFYLGSEDRRLIYQTAPEMQVLDNARHPDANMGKNGNRMAGSLYDLIPADPQNFRGAGEWNQAEVIYQDGHLIHRMNGEKVVECQVGSPEWNELVSASKFPALNPDWVNLQKEGYIGLQDHGNNVWYRNIQIKVL